MAGRPPAWAAAILAAALPALVVLMFTDLEHMLGRWIGHDGGLTPFLLVVAVFLLAWAPAVPILARCAAPAAGGAAAGGYVALVMAAVLAPLWSQVGPFIAFVWLLFATLVMAAGAAAGGLAAATQSHPRGGAAVVGLAILLALFTVPFMPLGPRALVVLSVPLALAVVGVVLWWRASRKVT